MIHSQYTCCLGASSPGCWSATYVEEVKLIGTSANAVGEQEHVSLQPRHLLRRVLEADTWTRHVGERIGWAVSSLQVKRLGGDGGRCGAVEAINVFGDFLAPLPAISAEARNLPRHLCRV